MKTRRGINRRTIVKTVGTGLALAGAGSAFAAAPKPKSKGLSFRNEDFYTNGKFDLEAAKDALIELFKYHHYPVFSGVRDKLWCTDYGLGEFLRVGLGANIFLNHKGDHQGDRYMLLDIYLLPNQMLPEHYHLKTPIARPKMEGWMVRNGFAYIVGEGEPTPGLREKMPESQRKSCTVWHAVAANPGEVAQLNRPTARHWQLAGPEGAIVSEAANYHDGEGVRHSNPEVVFP
ncbi:MAG: hypothetical protein GY872_05370 [Roseibacillus sp.]|nr:hypothetical protein [Roseibacillus sp.]HJM62147.1 hypothetical protein [Roseibacillus sp.]